MLAATGGVLKHERRANRAQRGQVARRQLVNVELNSRRRPQRHFEIERDVVQRAQFAGRDDGARAGRIVTREDRVGQRDVRRVNQRASCKKSAALLELHR